jgi:uncharacterized protein YbjT (DUF2867 family)
LIGILSQENEVVAVVRSSAALEVIKDLGCQAYIIDYTDADALASVASDCDSAVHLVGVIKKTGRNSYEQAHEIPCTALASAAEVAGLKQIVALSILGGDVNSGNGCLASRARSDAILIDAPVPAFVLRVPMVLGENDFAARALSRSANKKFGIGLRTTSLEQPIYAGDVVDAICAMLDLAPRNEIITLAGPESVSRSELIKRAGIVIGKNPVTLSIPLMVGRLACKVLELFMTSPPVTEDMIDLLDHDDNVNSKPAADELGIRLTPLDEMLTKVIASQGTMINLRREQWK